MTQVDMAADAAPALTRIMGGAWLARAVAVAARLGVADLLHGHPLAAAELAARLDANPDVLDRVLRLLAACGIFGIDAEGRYVNSVLSALLRTDHPRSLRHFVMLAGEEYTDAFGKLMHSVKTGESAFLRAFGGSVYDHMDQNPEAGRVYDLAMEDLARPVGHLLARRPEFASAGVIVDVGGGNGALLRSILAAHPRARGISADRADVCGRAAATLPPDISGRLAFVPTDFFAQVPAGDVHLAKNVLHNWTDARCRDILRGIGGAMDQRGTLMIIEPIVERDTPSPHGLMDSLLQAVICEGGTVARSEAALRLLVEESGLAVVEVERLQTGHGVIVCRK